VAEIPSPLHIAHGVLALDVGGLERIVLSLVRAGQQQGHRVSVVCVERPGKLGVEAQAEEATVVSLDKPSGRYPVFIQKATTVLAGLKPDIIHTHQIGAAWYLGQSARLLGRPVIHTEHGNHFSQANSWWKVIKTRLFMRSTVRHIDKFCCVSDEIAAAVTRWWTVPVAKVDIVANGIPTDSRADLPSPKAIRASLGISASAPVIGTVGRLAEVKQQGMLIRALQHVRRMLPTAHLVLIGDGPERSRLEALTHDLGLTDWIHFLGYQSRPEQYLRIMNVFSLTSRSEGFPVSLLEAWLAGVPTVCSAVGGIPDVVTHEVDGLLFPPGDDAGLVSSLIRILQDEPLRQRLAEAGGQVVRDRYSLGRMSAEYEARYRQLIVARPG
jgi:glycosyltransferase involved in cell wall biosynthesis